MATISLEDIYAPIDTPIKEIHQTILDILDTPNELAGEVVRHFFAGKGKLLRPALTLLGAGIKGADTNRVDPKLNHIAASFEIFHAATLIHDDIIDSAYLRRNLQTVNAKWDAQTAVLVGDYLHDKSLKMLHENSSFDIFSLFLKTAGVVCEGEIHELSKKRDYALTETEYLQIIEKKTAVLLACALEAGARHQGADENEAAALGRFGLAFGKAFQIVDDCLDYTGDENEFGKTLGADLQAGVLTLPMIRLLEKTPEEKRQEIIRTFLSESGKEEKLKELIAQIIDSGALEEAYQKAREFCMEAQRELSIFPFSASKNSLERLLDYVLERKK